MKVRDSRDSGTPFMREPAALGMRPVAMHARLGMQTGEFTYMRSNAMPFAASASMFGVRSCVLP